VFDQKDPCPSNFIPDRETSMMEDCATRMSEPHGCNDDTAVVESFKEALKQRVGVERYQMWFTHGIDFQVRENGDVDESVTIGTDARSSVVMVRVRGQFALDRIKNNMLRELRGAAMQACGCGDVELCLDQPAAQQSDLPLPGLTERPPVRRRRTKRTTSGRGKTRSLSSLVAGGAASSKQQTQQPAVPKQLELPNLSATQSGSTDSRQSEHKAPAKPILVEQTFGNFVRGRSNQLAHTAMTMVCQDPRAASPLFICGPTGTGKSHILAAIADQFRRRHRMRRVMLLSAEQFTNDFISSVGSSGIAAFRRRYRDVDALLIDGMQFLGAKKATLREMLYTVETVVSSGRPLIASGTQAPTEIQGLSSELAGRLAAGLVCPIQPIDMATRDQLLRREMEQRCQLAMPEATIEQINATLSGDGRVIQGVTNLTNTLQRMFGRIPTMDELRRFGGELLRSSQPVTTLSVIESAVCQAFQLPDDTLRGGAQTRMVTEPRMLAMYLSRQLTSSAYTEIARHFGGRSHSTAISAEKNVKKWLETQKSIGRGVAAMSAQEAIDRVESLLRTG
jgi:chromosomal replication initiator protein